MKTPPRTPLQALRDIADLLDAAEANRDYWNFRYVVDRLVRARELAHAGLVAGRMKPPVRERED